MDTLDNRMPHLEIKRLSYGRRATTSLVGLWDNCDESLTTMLLKIIRLMDTLDRRMPHFVLGLATHTTHTYATHTTHTCATRTTHTCATHTTHTYGTHPHTHLRHTPHTHMPHRPHTHMRHTPHTHMQHTPHTHMPHTQERHTRQSVLGDTARNGVVCSKEMVWCVAKKWCGV